MKLQVTLANVSLLHTHSCLSPSSTFRGAEFCDQLTEDNWHSTKLAVMIRETVITTHRNQIAGTLMLQNNFYRN
jgi:hypothetical protein